MNKIPWNNHYQHNSYPWHCCVGTRDIDFLLWIDNGEHVRWNLFWDPSLPVLFPGDHFIPNSSVDEFDFDFVLGYK